MQYSAPNRPRKTETSDSSITAEAPEAGAIGPATETPGTPSGSSRFSPAMYDYCLIPRYWETF
jgi:hypothetical protein